MRSLIYFISACVVLYLVVLVFFSSSSMKPSSYKQTIASLSLSNNIKNDRFQQLKAAEELLDNTVRRDKIHFLPAPKILEVSSLADQLKEEQSLLDGEEQELLSRISGIEASGVNSSRFQQSPEQYYILNAEDLPVTSEIDEANVVPEIERASIKSARTDISEANEALESEPDLVPAIPEPNTKSNGTIRLRPKLVKAVGKQAYSFDRAHILEQKVQKQVEQINPARVFSIKIASEALRPAPSYDAPPIRVLKKGSNIQFLYANNAWAYVQDDDGTRSWLRTDAIY